METKIELTKSELIAVFKAWYSEAVENPGWPTFDKSDKCAEGGADSFMYYLNKIQNK